MNDKDLYLFIFDYEKMVIDDKPVQKVKLLSFETVVKNHGSFL